jgi:hypothetical protein
MYREFLTVLRPTAESRPKRTHSSGWSWVDVPDQVSNVRFIFGSLARPFPCMILGTRAAIIAAEDNRPVLLCQYASILGPFTYRSGHTGGGRIGQTYRYVSTSIRLQTYRHTGVSAYRAYRYADMPADFWGIIGSKFSLQTSGYWTYRHIGISAYRLYHGMPICRMPKCL